MATVIKFPVKDGDVSIVVPVTVEVEGKKLALSFPWCPALSAEFKAMGAEWQGYKSPPRKVWTLDNNERTKFRFAAMRWMGTKDGKPVLGDHDPYARYDAPLVKVDCPPRKYRGELTSYYGHQPEGVSFIVTRRQCILAWDMGTGKTLVVGRAMEWAKENLGWGDEDFWFVCKNGALYQVMLDYIEWDIQVRPRFMSYEQMKSLVETWPKGKPAPKFVVFDESTQIKSPTAQRSEKAKHLADAMRAEWGPHAFIVLMTGTPAPKNPCDWWMQGEVACPGFIKEGNWNKFRARLALVTKGEREDGGVYNTVKKDAQGNPAWWDDERRCKACGEFVLHTNHSKEARLTGKGHPWEASVNEVLKLDSRLKGFVSKKFKKDCLDLPDRVYRIIRCRPTIAMQNAARLIAKAATGAADALVRLRELSDGFQYQDAVVDEVKCPMCNGTCTMLAKQDPNNPGLPPSDEALAAGRLEEYEKQCDECCGAGKVPVKQRQVARVACPKDDVLEELIQEHEDVGRLPVYCGFTGSVDRVVDVFLKNKWHVVRVDGRGWQGFAPEGFPLLPTDGKLLYHLFRFDLERFPKVAFVAQASTAAHGLNFDCAPTIVNYSRDFNFENAMQGDERNLRGRIAETLKRTGRTKVTVVDIIHLESDAYVLQNHKMKRRLQALTLGEVTAALDIAPPETSSKDSA